MRRAVLPQPLVVGVAALAPTAPGVVAGLVGQHGCLLRFEVDLAFGVVVTLWLVQDVHGFEGKPRRCGRLPPSAVPSVNVSSPTGAPDDPRDPAPPLSGYAGKLEGDDDCEVSDDFEEVWIDDLPEAVLALRKPTE